MTPPVSGPPRGAWLDRLAPGTKVPLLPSLLVPCCPHSGTTFLWRCMRHAFHPERVCARLSGKPGNPHLALTADKWDAASCGDRQYFLPGLAGNIQGMWDYRKEWFFYGGGAAGYTKGWDNYNGVELPLCYWETEFQLEFRQRRRNVRRAAGLATARLAVDGSTGRRTWALRAAPHTRR